MRIKNINGTSDTTCDCGSWLKHWEKFSGQKATYCSLSSCIKTDIVGAHVQKAEGWDSAWYIVPLCNAHNQSSEELEIPNYISLVPANKKETCEKENHGYRSSWA
ncbi:MAG TPA: hypothetical protein VN784_09930 [Candidatus Limnocylindrales bacterium]|nr:hypothetical protein [Candidatus Limnocylindrales bacterium]